MCFFVKNASSSSELEHCFMHTNGIRLHVVAAGPHDGPLVILLHGFPEYWYGFRQQISPLAQAGYRVLAPDQRGYNDSDKPTDVAAYHIDELAGDVIGLIKASGRKKALLVGHDWGAAVSWWLAIKHSHWIERMVILNVPHPLVMARTLRQNPVQLLRSSYFLFFQLPSVPEAILRMGNWKIPAWTMRLSSQKGVFTEAILNHYREAWSKPRAFTSMLHWYRAIGRRRPPIPENPMVKVPTLLIWGAREMFLDRRMAGESMKFCTDGELIFLPKATHWLHHEEPEGINGLIVRFFTGPG
jgi:epoxide hydrolase 4